MTTRYVHYILSGYEIKTYRRVLEKLAESAAGSRFEMIKQLIAHTYDVNGEDAVQVEEDMDLIDVMPLWRIIDKECERLGAEGDDVSQMALLELGIKLKTHYTGSTYSVIPRSE